MTPQRRGFHMNWRIFLNFWSVCTFLVIIYDFVLDNAIHDVLIPLLAIYTAALALYSAEKEFERWHHLYSKTHPGEMYVLFWTVLIVSLFILDIIFKKAYEMPSEIVATYIVVLGILTITKRSKNIFLSKRM
jgi:hypothetical protein